MTGVGFDQIVSRKLSYAYTGFYDDVVRKPDVYKEALIQAIINADEKNTNQRETDNLINLVSQAALTLAASEYAVATLTNYYRFMALRCLCQDYDFDFTGAVLQSNISPNQLTFVYSNQLRDKEIVQINGTNYYAKMIRPKVYTLYTDEGLITPTPADNKTLTTPKRFVNYYAKQQYEDQLIDLYGQPTIYLPRVTFADGKLKVAPNAVSATLRYIKTLPVQIDPTNNITDLELTYPYDLLIEAADQAVEKIALEKRNYTRAAVQKQDNQQSQTIIM